MLFDSWCTNGLSNRGASHMKNTRIIRALSELIPAHPDRVIHSHYLVYVARAHSHPDAHLFHCPPIRYPYCCVLQRNLRQSSQGQFLFFGEIRNDVRSHHTVTGHHDPFTSYLVRLAVVDVIDENITRTIRIAIVLYINSGTI